MPQGIFDIYGELNHDQITRFLNCNEYSLKGLWQYIKADIHQHEQTTGGVLIIE